MLLSPATAGIHSTPTADPTPPARWTKWWNTPLARVDYGRESLVTAWPEAVIPADRGITGDRVASLAYAGSTLDAAIAAAKAVARVPVQVDVDVRGGAPKTVSLNQAVGVLHDARTGAYWLAPLRTTLRHGDEWIDGPHSIDGAAFDGATPLLRTPKVRTASSDLVAVVGRDIVITPTRWTNAPDASRTRR